MSYALFREERRNNSSFQSEALRSNTQPTALSSIFFSATNVNALQEAIRYQVYVRSGNTHVIDKQSDTELKVIMRGIYLEYAKNSPVDMKGQVQDLNVRVLEFCVNTILSEINMHLYYINDISKLPEPMARGTSTNSAGSRSLFMKEF